MGTNEGDVAVDRADLEKIARTLEPGVHRRRKLLLSLLLGAGVLMLTGLAIAIEGRPAWTDLVGTLMNPVIMAAIVGGAIVLWVVARRRHLRKLRRVMRGHRRCPHRGDGRRPSPRRLRWGMSPRDEARTSRPTASVPRPAPGGHG